MKEETIHLGIAARYHDPRGHWVDCWISSPPWKGKIMVLTSGQVPTCVKLEDLRHHPRYPTKKSTHMHEEVAKINALFQSGRQLPRRLPTDSDLRRLRTAADALLAVISEPCPEDRAEAIKDGIRAIQSTEDFGYDEINLFVQAAEAILFKHLKEQCGEEV